MGNKGAAAWFALHRRHPEYRCRDKADCKHIVILRLLPGKRRSPKMGRKNARFGGFLCPFEGGRKINSLGINRFGFCVFWKQTASRAVSGDSRAVSARFPRNATCCVGQNNVLRGPEFHVATPPNARNANLESPECQEIVTRSALCRRLRSKILTLEKIKAKLCFSARLIVSLTWRSKILSLGKAQINLAFPSLIRIFAPKN